MTKRTQDNLSIGMHEEAFASAKCKRFAAFARNRQNGKLAKLLTEVADESRIEHFAREMDVAGLLSDDLSNVKDVVRDKLHQITRYKKFAQEAEYDGDHNAAALFLQLAADNNAHIEELEASVAAPALQTNGFHDGVLVPPTKPITKV